MRCTLGLAAAVIALGIGCKLDTAPGNSSAFGALDGAIGAADGGDPDGGTGAGSGGSDPGGSGAAGSSAGEGAGGAGEAGSDPPPDPCGGPCPEEAPACLESAAQCVQCTDDAHCGDPALPACDGDDHTCVPCTADMHCGGDTPRCDPDARACVPCLEQADCGGDTPRCNPATRQCVGCIDAGDCADKTQVCDPETLTCAECVVHADCAAPEKPECGDNACSLCTSADACQGRERATLCDLAAGSKTAGACVECTVDDEGPCSGKVCNPEARRCTDRPIGSKHTCQPCIADSECVADHRCIAMKFGDDEREQAYCMKRLSSGCARPYMSAPIRRVSLSGAAADDYCGIDELKTTCEAIAGLIADTECAGGSDAACAHPGSLCRTVNGGANRCTYGCDAAAQCPSGVACGSGYCGGLISSATAAIRSADDRCALRYGPAP